MILYSVNEKRIEVETGYGLEGILPDSKIGRMLDDYYVPQRDQGNVTQGIILFTQEISKVIQNNSEEVSSSSPITPEMKSFLSDLFPYFVFIIFIIIMKVLSRKRIKKCSKDGLPMQYSGMAGSYYIYKCANGHVHKELKSNHNNVAFLAGAASGGFGGGGGGFGGAGFGGGMSGGGGAGR